MWVGWVGCPWLHMRTHLVAGVVAVAAVVGIHEDVRPWLHLCARVCVCECVCACVRGGTVVLGVGRHAPVNTPLAASYWNVPVPPPVTTSHGRPAASSASRAARAAAATPATARVGRAVRRGAVRCGAVRGVRTGAVTHQWQRALLQSARAALRRGSIGCRPTPAPARQPPPVPAPPQRQAWPRHSGSVPHPPPPALRRVSGVTDAWVLSRRGDDGGGGTGTARIRTTQRCAAAGHRGS